MMIIYYIIQHFALEHEKALFKRTDLYTIMKEIKKIISNSLKF